MNGDATSAGGPRHGPWSTDPMRLAGVVAAGYVVGSIPVAVLVGRRRGVDVRSEGDANPGFWNARALLGVRSALPVFAGDMAKGLCGGLVGQAAGGGAYTMAGVGGAMAGHAWPAFAGFHGGRSVLTFVGGLTVISPGTCALAWGICGAVTMATGSFAYGARAGVASIPFVQMAVERDPYRVAGMGALMTFIGMRFATAAIARRRSRTSGPARSDPVEGHPR